MLNIKFTFSGKAALLIMLDSSASLIIEPKATIGGLCQLCDQLDATGTLEEVEFERHTKHDEIRFHTITPAAEVVGMVSEAISEVWETDVTVINERAPQPV